MEVPAAGPPSPSPPPFPEQLSAWYEELARSRPRRYRIELALLALLGHAYVAGVAMTCMALGILLALFARRGGVWVALLLWLAAARVLWVFWIRWARPLGVTLDGERGRGIQAIAERAAAALGCTAPRRVVVGVECSAAIDASVRRRRRRTLVVGLPVLLSLSVEELEAVIAHELGHVSDAHSRFGAWILYVRATWQNLALTVGQGGGPVAWALNLFATWYWPRFNAASLVQARASELQADRDAAALAGGEVFARGLARILVVDSRLDERFWPVLSLRAAEEAEPPGDVCEALAAELREPDPENDERLAHALSFRTMYWDTHPSLSDRLGAIGLAPPRLPPVRRNAAEHLLGAQLPALMTDLDGVWREAAAPSWTERHESLREGHARVAELGSQAAPGELDVDEAWEHASWTEELRGADAALPLYRALVDRAPEHRAAQLALGRLLLRRKDPAGAALAEAAMADPWLVMSATELLYEHCTSQQRHDEADRWHRLGASHADAMQKAAQERSVLHRSDRVEPHGLGPRAVERLRRALAANSKVKEAYVVRKAVTVFPEKPCFVVGVREGVRWYLPSAPAETLIAELAASVSFSEPLLFVHLDHDGILLHNILQVKGARILPE
jgi:Zn-dependent protease with chaperone function